MVLQRNKGVLEENIFTKNNQQLFVRDMAQPLLLIQRDAIPMEMSMIETADKRRMPGGRNNSGEFNAVVQLAHDEMRTAMLNWYGSAQDRGRGVSGNYKRNGVLVYNRLIEGSARAPFRLNLVGLWVMRLEFPEFDMAGGDEGDADAHVTVQFCFDDCYPEPSLLSRATAGIIRGFT